MHYTYSREPILRLERATAICIDSNTGTKVEPIFKEHKNRKNQFPRETRIFFFNIPSKNQ